MAAAAVEPINKDILNNIRSLYTCSTIHLHRKI